MARQTPANAILSLPALSPAEWVKGSAVVIPAHRKPLPDDEDFHDRSNHASGNPSSIAWQSSLAPSAVAS